MTSVDGDLRRKSTGDLVKTLSEQVSTLLRQEAALAKTELAEKGRKAGIGAGLLTGGGVAAVLALGSLTAFVILLLDLALPAWLAALIVTALWSGVAAALALQGRQKVQEIGKPLPEKTVESVKEDVEWLRHPTR
jgi:hypothetical protein